MRLLSTLVFGFLLVSPLPAQEAKTPKRPNILWITCEDIGPHLGCYGDKYAVTPVLDKLAKRSLRYNIAWSNAPVCAPARTTIITGMYPPSTGSEHMRSLVKLPANIEMFPVLLRRLGYYCTNHIKEDYNLEKAGKVWDDSSKSAHYKNRPKDAPFFAVFNILITHESQIRKRPHKLVHDPAKAPIPAYHPDTPEVRHDWAQYYDNITTMDRMVGELLAELEALGLADDTIIFFYSDHGSGMPRNKRTPLDCGLHVPMLVHIPANFRDLAPKEYVPGGETDRLVSFVDLAPTVVSLAGSAAPPHMHGKAFLGSHAAAPNEYLFGFRGRMDERYDLVRSIRDKRYVYARNYMPHRIPGQHVSYMFETPTTQVWKKLFDAGQLKPEQAFFWQPRPHEELYDLETDPFEVHNLAESKTHQTELKRLRERLMTKIRTTRDVDFLPEDELHRRSKGSTPYELAQDAERYPCDKIITFAEIASQTGAAAGDRLKAGLNDRDAAVRYWSAVGIYGRGKEVTREHRADLARLLTDPAPCVRIIAAEALGKYGDQRERKQAIDALLPLAPLKNNEVYVSLQALNALDYVGLRKDEGWTQIEHAADGEKMIEPRVQGMPARLVESIREKLGK
jgi:uncharacterized sulfatase